ncbi:MAG: hypothetical protein ABIS07_13460 [Dokdonella sp.]
MPQFEAKRTLSRASMPTAILFGLIAAAPSVRAFEPFPVCEAIDPVQFCDVEDIVPPTGVKQLIYSATHGALVLKNSQSAIGIIKLDDQSSSLRFSYLDFTDMSISPSGRYVFAADYGGENIGYGTPWQTSHVHRLDLADYSWDAKTAYIAGHVQAIADDQVILKSIDQWVTFTNNSWGAGNALVTLNAASGSWGPAYYAGVYEGDFRYVASSGRLLHGNSGVSSQEIQAFRLTDNDFARQEGSGIYGSAQGYGESIALATDQSAAYYGALQVDPLDVTHNLRIFPELIVAATGDIAFGEDSYYDARSGALLGHLGFTSSVYGLNTGGTDFWAFDSSQNLLRHFVRNDRIFSDGVDN